MRYAQLMRWALLLQEFNLHVKYISGVENIVDELSRNRIGRNDPSTVSVTQL